MAIIDVLKEKAKADKKTIVLPESEDRRTYEAAAKILKEGIADIILVGSEEDVKKNGEGLDLTGIKVVDPATADRTAAYIDKLVELKMCIRDSEHSDHIRGLGVLARKYGIPIYSTPGTINAMLEQQLLGKVEEGLFPTVTPDCHFEIGDLEVQPFRVSHDAAEPEMCIRARCRT